MGLPLDAVEPGDWLLCVRGNRAPHVTQIGEIVEITNHEMEGTLSKVIAISAPMVYVKTYPVPCEDISHPYHPSFNLTWKWGEVEFIRPSRGYLRAYLRRVRKAEKEYLQMHPLGGRVISRTYGPPPDRGV